MTNNEKSERMAKMFLSNAPAPKNKAASGSAAPSPRYNDPAVETRSKRKELLLKPSQHDKLLAIAKNLSEIENEPVSFNELVCRIFDEYLKDK